MTRRFARCIYPGCTAHGSYTWMATHVELEHVQCICGWVGMRRGFWQHVGQRARRSPDPWERGAHRVATVLDKPAE